ncbi:hypothetical protein QC763_607395 [Podospora pseudopauciseta]|uniref:Fungal N-terminal domain-containing protein n=1 Tax=Podospora pseudopauciseta TaxID=2093780 RepID=A0ABR0H5W2_9PEZI|nr:hypothetical protein QC763_607395 [Podospora pseudopauciseta]
MEPLEIVGAVAAIGQLLELCIKAGKTSTQLVKSFINAPAELRNLSAKLASLQMIIQQFQALGQDLLMTGVEDILPATHKDMLLSSLLGSERALKNLTTLHNTAGQSSTPKPGCNFSRRLLWSLIDKKRSTMVIEELRKAEMVLDTVMLILNTRLNSHIWTSFSAMQLAQQTFRADFLQSARDVKTIVEAQHYTISEFKANADHTLLSILQLQTENDIKVQVTLLFIKSQLITIRKGLHTSFRAWSAPTSN